MAHIYATKRHWREEYPLLGQPLNHPASALSIGPNSDASARFQIGFQRGSSGEG
jgi:hypothetical protein